MTELLSNAIGLTLLVSALSLLGVWLPFYRGARIGMQALGATRPVGDSELGRTMQSGGPARPSVTVQMLHVLRSALRESKGSGQPASFVVDASRQYVLNEYDARYARPISMFANMLPPIGFIGTTGGLLILFLSMRVQSETLELGALALALTSSFFALIGFAVLEALRIQLYRRTLSRLDDALTFHRVSAARAQGAQA